MLDLTIPELVTAIRAILREIETRTSVGDAHGVENALERLRPLFEEYQARTGGAALKLRWPRRDKNPARPP